MDARSIPQNKENRNIVANLPAYTAMSCLQRNQDKLPPGTIAQSGAINGGAMPYACQVASITTKFLREAMPEDYR